jgi:hypothetical protein
MAVQVLALQQRATANDANGNPLAGALIYTYETGTTTPLATYTTSALSVANANPIVADSAGRFGPIYTNGATAVKAVITTAAGATVDTLDPAPFVYDSQSAASSISFTPNATLTGDDVQAALDQVTDLLTAGKTSSATAGGTVNAITLTTGLGLTSVPSGFEVIWRPTGDNTTATTINLDGTGAVTNSTMTGAATPAAYIRQFTWIRSIYLSGGWVSFVDPRYGSGVNGTYVRWPNGTQECWFSSTFSSGTATWTYPIAFSAAPIVTGTVVSSGNSRVFTTGTPGTTSCALYGWTVAGAAAASEAYSVYARGLWYTP